MRTSDKKRNIERANLLAESRFLRESSLLTEENINDFFEFVEKDPQKCSKASLQYAVQFNTGLSRGKKNEMANRIIKVTNFAFNYAETYKDAAMRSNPDWEIQQRKGGFEEIQGFSMLDRDRQGDEGLPIVNPRTIDAYIIVLDKNGQEEDRFDYRELQSKLGQYYIPSAFNPKPRSGSGSDQRSLKVKRILMIKAGGNDWRNPNHELKNLNLDIPLPNVPCER